MKIELRELPSKEPLKLEYQFSKTKIGNLLIASWGVHLVYIAFAVGQKEALKQAKTRFPGAIFSEKEKPIHKQFLTYLKDPKKFTKTLLIAVAGSPFQRAVWKALLKVAFGKTLFYSDLAKILKKPSAVRAVASAVAKNPMAILIPCHRVLPRSGGIGNYHWGSQNKKALLVWERLGQPKE